MRQSNVCLVYLYHKRDISMNPTVMTQASNDDSNTAKAPAKIKCLSNWIWGKKSKKKKID